jgi:tRNA-uridine 2-sulfurtransferase
VRRVMGANGAELHRAIDPARDQSYFLFATTREQLDFLRFPLGGMHKPEVRTLAERFGLVVADKPDSQDICFVPDRDYAALIRKLRPEGVQPGEIVDLEGHVLGQHAGIIHYTIGQRRGLGLAGGEPLYVVRIDARARRVIVGPREALRREDIRVTGLNWLGEALGEVPRPVHARIRSAKPPVPAEIRVDGQGPIVTIRGGEHGVSPGQACVIYAGEGPGQRVLGGGFIARG